MRLLIIRFSALGDVAMTVPVIDSLAQQYTQLEITVLSKPFMQPLFAKMPTNVCFRGIKVEDYKGFIGLFRLFCILKKDKYDAVADLHDVLRSKVLRILFSLWGTKVAHIDKGRKGKKELIRPEHKVMKQLPSSFLRYEAVFKQLGYPVTIQFHSIFGKKRGDSSLFQATAGNPEANIQWIGIAPFAAHKGKRLPESTVATLILTLSAHKNYRIFLFGGGKEEKELLEHWAANCPNVQSLAGKLKLNEELALMSHLKVMVTMDSGNMHLASLVGIPVVSVWGATHPFAGFMGWGQSIDNAVQTDLPCRPCSIFGDKPCFRKDYACLRQITPQQIIEKIETILNA